MIKGAFEYFSSAIASLKPKRDNPHRDIFGRVIEHGEEFFHPQTFKGIPVFDTNSIMRHYKPLLDKLQLHTDIGSHRRTPDGKHNLFDALYTDIVRRYIEFAHMIPASEDHHHAHTGGLIVHSLEVSIASLRYAKEVEVPKTGFSDLDQQLKPIMHYCAWMAGLLHDAGKIMIDISVDAAEVLHPLTKRPIPIINLVPSWRPQKESLTAWALRYNVASYSVSFYNDRKHKRHNVDSAQIIKPLLDGTYALDYILESPLKNETYSELCRVLSGYTMSKDYLSTAVRHGDADSTGRNVGIEYDRVRGNRVVSTASRIYHAIKNARKDWDWNITNAEGWVIAGDVYLRWTSAIDSIIRVAKEMQFALPSDARNLLTIMESNGLVQMYDKTNRMVKFFPGSFTPEDIPMIASGQRNIRWMDLFKMRGREMVFGADPMPDSVPGILFLPENKVFVIIDSIGNSTRYDVSGGTGATPEVTVMGVGTEVSDGEVEATKIADKGPALPASRKVVAQKSAPAKPKPANTKDQKKTPKVISSADETNDSAELKQTSLQFLPRETSLSNSDAVEMMFNNGPSSRLEDKKLDNIATGTKPSKSKKADRIQGGEQVASIPAGSDNTNAEHELDLVTLPKRCSPVLAQLLNAQVRYHAYKGKILIDCLDAEQITSLPIKDIISDLEKGSHLSINLMNPNQKIENIQLEGELVKAIPVAPALNRYFAYTYKASDIPVETVEVAELPVMKCPAEPQPTVANTSSNDEVASQLFTRREDKIQSGKTEASTQSLKEIKAAIPKVTSKQQAGAIIADILSSDAIFFVLSGYPHLEVASSCKVFNQTIEEFVDKLHAAKMIYIEVGSSNISFLHDVTHEGVNHTVIILKKQYAKFFSSLDIHTKSTPGDTDSGSKQDDMDSSSHAYSTQMIMSNVEEGSLAKFLNNFPEAKDVFFVAGADHIKVNTFSIIKVMTARKSEFPFGQSALKAAIRKNTEHTEEIDGITYSCIPNALFKSIKLSEV